MERSPKSLRRLNLIKNQLKKTEEKSGEPARVLITGASGNIGYALSFMIAQGRMLGSIPVILHLFDLPSNINGLKGLSMELFDGAFENLNRLLCGASSGLQRRRLCHHVRSQADKPRHGEERPPYCQR